MEINLLPILNYDGKKIVISEDVDITSSPNDNFNFKSPVHFEGYALNIGGTIELKGKANASLSVMCDRCVNYYDKNITYDIFESFKKEDNLSTADEDEDITPLEGSSIDLDSILYTGLILSLPSKSLCSEECKGLCPVCGKNLNNETCTCSIDNTDPRFDILDKLL